MCHGHSPRPGRGAIGPAVDRDILPGVGQLRQPLANRDEVALEDVPTAIAPPVMNPSSELARGSEMNDAGASTSWLKYASGAPGGSVAEAQPFSTRT